jgi:hypothetical protein
MNPQHCEIGYRILGKNLFRYLKTLFLDQVRNELFKSLQTILEFLLQVLSQETNSEVAVQAIKCIQVSYILLPVFIWHRTFVMDIFILNAFSIKSTQRFLFGPVCGSSSK